MREDCKFFQSRTYPSGDQARFCALSLAPEAPWRCPTDCRRFEGRLPEAGFGPRPPQPAAVAGGAAVGPPEAGGLPEPEVSDGVADVLGAAAGIVSAARPEIVADQERTRRRQEWQGQPWWQKLRRQPRWR